MDRRLPAGSEKQNAGKMPALLNTGPANNAGPFLFIISTS